MLVYILLVLGFTLSAGNFKFGSHILRKSLCILSIIALIIFTALRYDVGYDYSTYYGLIYPYFDYIEYERLEIGAKLITFISCKCKEPHLQFVIYSLITYLTGFYSFYKYSNNFPLSSLVYLAFFYLSSLGIIRQATAVAFIILSYRQLVDKNIFKYLICISIAFLFHKTALICLIFYPLYHYCKKSFLPVIIIFSLFAIATILNYLLSQPLFEQYFHYLDGAEEMKGGSITKFVYLVLALILLYLSFRQKNESCFKLVTISLLGISLPFFIGGHLGGRMSEYFMAYYCFIIPLLIKNYNVTYKRTIAFMFSLYFLLNIYVSTTNSTKSPYTPYQCVLFVDRNPPKFK